MSGASGDSVLPAYRGVGWLFECTQISPNGLSLRGTGHIPCAKQSLGKVDEM